LKKFTESKLKLEDVQNNEDARKLASSFNVVYRNNVILIEELFKLIN
jgi:hypothetical protein